MQYRKNKLIQEGEGVSVKLYTHGTSARHSHEFVELTYVLDGRGRHIVGDESMDVSAGDMFIIDLGVEHEYVAEGNEKFTLCNCLFYPEFLTRVITAENFIELAYDMFFSGYAEEKGAKGYLCLQNADTSEIRSYILSMVREQEEKEAGKKEQAE